jgi:hypothetical protein
MNKLQLRAARPRTASIFHRHKASHGISRPRHIVTSMSQQHDASTRRVAPLRAQWVRNPTSGALECRWMADAGTEPPMHRATLHIHPILRMPRRISRAGMRPPSR